MKLFCSDSIPLPSELKMLLNDIFSKQYLSLNGFSDNPYYYLHLYNDSVRIFEMLSDENRVMNLKDFFSDYKKLYLMTNRYLIMENKNCTWQKLIDNYEKNVELLDEKN